MIDIPALKARLSNPRDVAALLGLRTFKPGRNTVYVRCPLHGEKTPSMRLRNNGDGVKYKCFGCNRFGDAIDLIGAIAGDPRRALARASALVGGGVALPYEAEPEPERCDPDLYHELATRILEAGKLDGRPWTHEVGEYLQRRGLLELAQGDGWAALPSLRWLLDIAKEVCDANCDYVRATGAELVAGGDGTGFGLCKSAEPSRGLPRRLEEGGHVKPHDLLVSAELAKVNAKSEFVASWKGWNLVIPWRGLDGRINALQRRRTWEWKKRNEGDTEPGKYVLPWAPEWPYGSERLVCDGLSSNNDGAASGVLGRGGRLVATDGTNSKTNNTFHDNKAVRYLQRNSGLLHYAATSQPKKRHIAIVEGAVDTLAMRALYPSFVALGIPGIGGWRASWAPLVGGRGLRVAIDRGKPGSDGIIPEDRAAARIALDCVGRGQETDRVLEWWLGRWRRGRALGCVLCGAGEAWLCGACGRRRAPVGLDWGGAWEARMSLAGQ